MWIVFEVYENDLPTVHVGEYADIHLNACPDRALKRKISNVNPILDIHTAKVRLADRGLFQRVDVVAGTMLPGGLQAIESGFKPGQQVVSRSLVFQNASEQ